MLWFHRRGGAESAERVQNYRIRSRDFRWRVSYVEILPQSSGEASRLRSARPCARVVPGRVDVSHPGAVVGCLGMHDLPTAKNAAVVFCRKCGKGEETRKLTVASPIRLLSPTTKGGRDLLRPVRFSRALCKGLCSGEHEVLAAFLVSYGIEQRHSPAAQRLRCVSQHLSRRCRSTRSYGWKQVMRFTRLRLRLEPLALPAASSATVQEICICGKACSLTCVGP